MKTRSRSEASTAATAHPSATRGTSVGNKSAPPRRRPRPPPERCAIYIRCFLLAIASSEASSAFAQCSVGGGWGPEYCALICGPNGAQGGTCPEGMSCESVQDTGFCMWPMDLPSPDSEVAADVSE